MAMLKLPYELLMFIARQLEFKDLKALLQCHPYLYHSLNNYLYYYNVHHHDTSALFWATTASSDVTIKRLLDAEAKLSVGIASSQSRPLVEFTLRGRAEGIKEHPISYAASHGHAEIVAKLLDQNVDINYQDPDDLPSHIWSFIPIERYSGCWCGSTIFHCRKLEGLQQEQLGISQ